MSNLRLDHLYMPARKPEWLAEWYAETFGFRAKAGFVETGGVMLVFRQGVPVHHGEEPRFGFRCDSKQALEQFASRLNATVSDEGLFCSFVTADPEGYRFEVYWEDRTEGSAS